MTVTICVTVNAKPTKSLKFAMYPCKIRTGILAGSRWDPGEILAAGIFLPSRNLAGIPARFSPGSEIFLWSKSRWDPAANLAKILAEKQKSRRPKSRLDPAANLAKILAGKQ